MKLALLGDIHGYFDEFDVHYFNESDYDYILFTGDLADFLHISKRFYSYLKQLNKKCFLMWGNHDGFSFFEVVSELFQFSFQRIDESKFPIINKRLEELQQKLGNHFISGGYQIHLLDEKTAIFMVRPHSIGGKRIGYRNYLKQAYTVSDFESSYQKMKILFDDFYERNPQLQSIIFLGHNGPATISKEPVDLWGCDFKPELGDFGDLDFYQIIQYVKSKQIQVPLVVAGHMHHRLAKKAIKFYQFHHKNINFIRKSIFLHQDTYYVNPAKVPRIFRKKQDIVHYHIFVDLNEKKVNTIEEKYVYKNENQ